MSNRAPLLPPRPTRGRLQDPAIRLAAPTLALLLLALSGCGTPEREGTVGAAAGTLEPVVRDSAGIRIREYPDRILSHPAPRQLAPSPRVVIGVVEGEAAYQWTRPVAAVRLSGGGFAVAEQSPGELRIFDAQGTHLHSVGSSGEGPGEFRQLSALFRLPGDTLLAWDAGSLRLSWFTERGAFVRDRAVGSPGGLQGIRAVTVDAEGGILLAGPTVGWEELENRGRVRESWRLVPLDPHGEARRPLGTFPGSEREVFVTRTGPGTEGIVSAEVRGRWWWGEGFARGSHRGAWTADRLRLEVRHFGGGEEAGSEAPDQIVRVMASDRPFTRVVVDSLHADELARVEDPALRRLREDDIATRDYPERIPPVENIFTDRNGGLWIGLTPLPRRILPSGGRTAVERWLVLDPADARGILTLPPMSHPLWADDEGVLILRNDQELGVAYLEWYPFAR